MHHPDYLLSNAAEYTGRIDSALVSRKVAFSVLERRYGVLEAFTFWVGNVCFALPTGPHLSPSNWLAACWKYLSRTSWYLRRPTCHTSSPVHRTDKIRWHSLFIHNPHGVLLWAFVVDRAHILRLRVRAGYATTFSAFVMHPVSLRMVYISLYVLSIDLPPSIPPSKWVSHKIYSSWRRLLTSVKIMNLCVVAHFKQNGNPWG